MPHLTQPLIPDAPAKEDRLGFQPMADILVEAIERTPPPFTVGVFGEWGSGKSTLMNLMRGGLDAAPGIKTAWFNAWKYEGKEVLWNALIQTIFLAMREDADCQRDASFLKDVGEVAKNLAKFAARKTVRFVPGGLLDAGDVDAVIGAFAPLTAEDPEFAFINTFESRFDGLVQRYVGEGGRLVVFVDDLDRCLPENAVTVLEAIKLYLDHAAVTFVIGVERAVIERGIDERYRSHNRLSGKEYLEKMVQLPFVMRGLSRDAALRLLAPYADAIGHAGDPMLERLILQGTAGNPRRLLRFVNTFCVLSALEGRPSGDDAQRLALVLLTQARFPDIYDHLVRDPGLIKAFNRVVDDTVDRRESALARSEPLRHIYEDLSARSLFESVRNLECGEDVMARWVRLTEGEMPAEPPK